MSRYIDADELKRNHMFYHEADNRSYAEERDIDETPTVDAVPVVHGEWVEKWRFKPNGNPYHKVGDMECSVCHSDMLGRYYSRYCPHCGARMDGERKDGEHEDGRTD